MDVREAALERSMNRIPWIVCMAIVGLVCMIRLGAVFNEYPDSFVDEVIYTEPALQLAQTGKMSAPGIASQLAEKGAPGLHSSFCITLPTVPVIRAGLIKAFGTPSLLGLRISDWVVMLFALTMLYGVSRQIASSWLYALVLAVFVLNPIFLWANPGRQDILAMAFGLSALWMLLYATRSFHEPLSWRMAIPIGLLLGISATCHPFAGIFWSAVLSTFILTSTNIKQALLNICLIGAAAAVPCILAGIYILTSGPDGLQQFKWLLALKKQLNLNFINSAKTTFIQSLGRNPSVLIILLLGFSDIEQKWRKIALGLVGILILLAIWRCASFESYNHSYTVHFWAALMVLLLLVLDGMYHTSVRWKRLLVDQPAFQAILILALVGTGLVTGYNKWMTAFGFNRVERHREITRVVAATVPQNARVLVTCDAYFLVSHRDKVAMASHERLDIKSFDYIIARERLQTIAARDQWFDILTPTQYKDLEESFGEAAFIPATRMELTGFPAGIYRPTLPGLVVYEKKD